MRPRMLFDDVAWEESERVEHEWIKSLFEESTLRAIGDFIVKHRGGIPTELCDPKAGTFNALFRMKFQDGGSAVIRFPKPGVTMFPEEKIRYEVAMIRYIQDHTTIPVPFILHWGTKEESPLGLGPFIIMDYINHEMDMGAALNTAGRGTEDRPLLDPNIDPAKLEMLYRQMADILLQLSTLELPAIGSLQQTDEFSWGVTHRPLSMHMNELVRLGTLPRAKLPDARFKSSSDYFESLSQLHLEHLTWQRNDAVQSKPDCQRKYVARHLFRKLAIERKLLSGIHDIYNNGPFKIWCDDLRPTNILLDASLQIVGVVDWEFAYAAPAEFSFAPPWWLLLEQPEYWPNGINEWSNIYEGRLQTFLKVLEECEASAIASGRLQDGKQLSFRMRQSWDDGEFWIVYAARKNFAFDAIFWEKLDPKFFGPGEAPEDAWKQRLGLLDEQVRENMEPFVEKKLKDNETRELAWELDELIPSVEN
ncbi:hypothetical protein MY3296_006802 [Beauveria thailandica]